MAPIVLLLTATASWQGLAKAGRLPPSPQVEPALVLARPLVEGFGVGMTGAHCDRALAAQRRTSAPHVGQPMMRAGKDTRNAARGSRSSKYNSPQRYRSAPQRQIEEKFGERPVRIFSWTVALGIYALIFYGIFTKAAGGS
mmetsp:Transcript_12979/g.41702  ORF Transcript_12979/g.41702 Transcript_12979/m.41702 type:complete len:141 (-) Transcript_12979:58-480(-)